jgi:hypothetical protein
MPIKKNSFLLGRNFAYSVFEIILYGSIFNLLLLKQNSLEFKYMTEVTVQLTPAFALSNTF